jgi:peroxiredoxin family protein
MPTEEIGIEPVHEAHEHPMIEREVPEEKPDKLVIVAWGGDLDRLWPQMILATTGVAMGMETTVFFTFWGLFSLLKNDEAQGRMRRLTGENWMQKMLSMMNKGGTEHAKLSKMNFAGMGPWMMGSLAESHKVASPRELLEMAQDMGVHLVPCQMTMDLMGLTTEDMVDGLDAPAGATTMLLEAKDAITFFI